MFESSVTGRYAFPVGLLRVRGGGPVIRRALGVLMVSLVAAWSGAVTAGVVVEGVRAAENGERTRVVFDLSASSEHNVFTLTDPARVVIDFPDARLEADMLNERGVLRGMRSGVRGERGLRIVLDLAEEVRVRSFAVGPVDQYGNRLVVDLRTDGVRRDRREPVRTVEERGVNEVVVAIDAGHGGVDPGAVGPGGTFEKDIALAMAKRLRDLMEREPGLTPVLIRTGDYYMGLRDRTRRAHEQNADVFISLHIDAIDGNRNVRGASVYALSRDGASSEAARLLARRENAADMIGGVSLSDKDDTLASVLVDLSRAHTIEASLEMGGILLNELGANAELHRNRVEQAGFAVLKSLDMPSLLVELGFMTNPHDERRLNDPRYQQQLAEALLRGVRGYSERYLLPDLRQAQDAQEHRVARGETLSAIARRYRVSLQNLRAANDLADDRIAAGTTLVIP